MEDHQTSVNCKWTGCTSRFDSELDMGLHVMANHLNVLDYGHFVLNRRAQNGGTEQPEQVPAPEQTQNQEPGTPVVSTAPIVPKVSTSPAGPTTPSREETNTSFRPKWALTPAPDGSPEVKRLHIKRVTRLTVLRQAQETPASESLDIKPVGLPSPDTPSGTPPPMPMSRAARILLNRLRKPPTEPHRLFQTEHFCLICQHNHLTPCKKKHRKEELQVVADWKRIYGHLKPAKKLVLKQIKQMADSYEEDEVTPRAILMAGEDQTAPGNQASTPAPPALASVKTEPMDPELDGPGFELMEQDSTPPIPNRHRTMPLAKPEPRGYLYDDAMDAQDFAVFEAFEEPPRSAPTTLSKQQSLARLCSNLIYRLRTRHLTFREQPREGFCINCLSFNECQKDHGATGRLLAKKWKRRFGNGDKKLTDYLLIGHLEDIEMTAMSDTNQPNPV